MILLRNIVVFPALMAVVGCINPNVSLSVELECIDFGVESPLIRATGDAFTPGSGVLEVRIADAMLVGVDCSDWLDESDNHTLVCVQAIGGEISWEAQWTVTRGENYVVHASLEDTDRDVFVGQWESPDITCD